MVQKSHGGDASVAEARACRRHASLKKGMNRFNIHVAQSSETFHGRVSR